jgi:hypothetical protein
VSLFDGAVAAIRERLARYDRLRGVTLEVGEFAVLGDERGRRLYAGDTTEWSASFFAALADRIYANDVRKVYEWDHATFGVLHPRGRVIEMLRRIVGGERLAVDVASVSGANCGAIACRKEGDLYVLLYNHRPARQASVPETVHLVVEDGRMQGGAVWRASEWLIDRSHGTWAYEFEADCTAAGLRPLDRAGLYEGAVLRLYGEPGIDVWKANADKYARLSAVGRPRDNLPVTVGDGQLTLDIDMAGHSVRLLKLSPAP